VIPRTPAEPHTIRSFLPFAAAVGGRDSDGSVQAPGLMMCRSMARATAPALLSTPNFA
jgi:hypothetical protein